MSKEENEVQPSDDNPLSRGNLRYNGEHLPRFHVFQRALALQGDEYLPLQKALWYQAASMPFRKINVKYGDLRDDLRVHLAVVLPSGGGKKNIISTMEKIFKEHYDIEKPTSFHPEQFIGKTKEVDDEDAEGTVYKELTGRLDSDLLLIDEALDLLKNRSDKYKDIRGYLNEGLDPYCSNEISKNLVDIPKEQGLSFKPPCNVSIFLQPRKMNEEIALRGTLRRFMTPLIDYSVEPDRENYRRRVKPEGMPRNKAVEKFSKFTEIRAKDYKQKGKIRPTEQALERSLELHKDLLDQGFAHSSKCKRYTRIVDYQLHNILLKMAGIQAAIKGKEKITEKEIEYAFIDFTEIFACILEFVYRKIEGNLKYGQEGQMPSSQEDEEIIQWLYHMGATSKEKSEISVSEYVSKAEDIFDVSESMARKHYQRHKSKGWIKYKQTGQTETKVWLLIIPEDDKGDKGVNHYRQKLQKSNYFDLVSHSPDEYSNVDLESFFQGN